MIDKLNPAVKEKWVAALRSGEYQQTKQVLRNEEGYCCLGVLCDVLSKEGITQLDWALNEDSAGTWYTFGEFAQALPPSEVTHALGLDQSVSDVRVTVDGVTQELFRHNDLEEVPFSKLADAIEEQL